MPLSSRLVPTTACVPSILTGNQPRDHGHWSFFYHTRERSPFRPLRLLRWLPGSLADRGRVRNWISKFVKRAYGFQGYFQLYNMPFRLIDRFDYCEKKDLFAAGGLNRGESIFDRLDRAQVPYHVSDWRCTEDDNLASLVEDIDHDRGSHDVLNLVAGHARLQLIDHVLGDDIALLHVDPVHDVESLGTPREDEACQAGDNNEKLFHPQSDRFALSQRGA